MSKGIICFDMDGTIADLYKVENWLEHIEKENPMPYVVANPMYDMEKLNAVLNKLIAQGWEVRVITWTAKDASKEYNEAVRAAKLWWLHYYNFPYQKAHIVAYGTTKANTIRRIVNYSPIPAILIDDNSKVRQGWTLGEAIDPRETDVIEYLKKLIERE